MNVLVVIIVALVVYLAYLFSWATLNLLFYFFAIAFKKPGILGVLTVLGVFAINIFDIVLWISLAGLGISLILNRDFLWFVILVLFGWGLISGIVNYLKLPFLLVSGYFTTKIEEIDFKENIVSAEIIDKENKVIGKIEGNTTKSVRLAKYFVMFFALNLISLIFFPDESRNYAWLDYLLTPTTQVFGGTIMVGIPYLLYHKIRYKSFFNDDKRDTLLQVWKICLYILVPLGVLLLLIALLLRH